jgi:hypothetical protein
LQRLGLEAVGEQALRIEAALPDAGDHDAAKAIVDGHVVVERAQHVAVGQVESAIAFAADVDLGMQRGTCR